MGTRTTCLSLQGLVRLAALNGVDAGLKSPIIIKRGLAYFFVNSIREVVKWSVSCCTVRVVDLVGKYCTLHR